MNRCWLYLVALVLAHSALADTVVLMDGSQLIYNGGLTEEANARLFHLYESAPSKPQQLVINSTGGAIDIGLELGEWVHARGLEVVVEELCFSSCANYVFPAGSVKYLGRTAVLGWHGGAHSERFTGLEDNGLNEALAEVAPDEREATMKYLVATMDEYLASNRQRETAFYRLVGVDPAINTLGHRVAGHRLRDGSYNGWYYSLADMRVLGLENIVVLGGEWQPATEKYAVFRVALPERE